MSDKIREEQLQAIAEKWREAAKLGCVDALECALKDAWQAALSQQQAPVAVPDGWKMVPVKPTIEMVEAGYEASVGQPDRSGHARAIEMFDAMLAAAPRRASTGSAGAGSVPPERCPLAAGRAAMAAP